VVVHVHFEIVEPGDLDPCSVTIQTPMLLVDRGVWRAANPLVKRATSKKAMSKRRMNPPKSSGVSAVNVRLQPRRLMIAPPAGSKPR
jgi:hypothetical protein